MAPTIRDVARAAGVSASTVSRALSAPGMVDAVTRERVTRIAESLGYRPNRAARGLITGRTGNLGLILPDLTNPFFPAVVKGIQRRAHEADYQVFVADTDEDPRAEIGLVRSLAKQVDGIVLCSPRMRPAELREAAGYVPVVLGNREAGSTPAVILDHVQGMRSIVDHLTGLGHRRLGFIAGPRSSWSSRERLKALRPACAASGAELVELGHFAPTFDGGADAAEGVLIAGVTAAIAYNDLVALGLLHTLLERGIAVPSRLSIVGVDDIAMTSMVRPALTTLDLPKQELGSATVSLLLQILADPDAPAPRRRLPTRLVVRDTTAPPTSTHTETRKDTSR